MAYNKEQLEAALVALWKASWNKLSPNMQDLLLTEHFVFRELEEFGEDGPVGLGLGNFGGHAIGDDDED